MSSPVKPQTVDEIVDDVMSQIPLEELKRFASYTHLERALALINLGRAIRNEYGLWVDHPLTEKWRTDPKSRKIVGGVDESPDHPDNLSGQIVEKF